MRTLLFTVGSALFGKYMARRKNKKETKARDRRDS